MARIFISYKRGDKERVFKIKDLIEKNVGEKCWVDLDGIESDSIFKSVIIRAINECEVLLFMYSERHSQIINYESDWTMKELNFASYKKKRIVFVNIDGSPLTDIFAFDYDIKQQIDGRSDEALERLCNDMRRWLKIVPAVNTEDKCEEKTQVVLSEDVLQLLSDYSCGQNGKPRHDAEAVKLYEVAAEQGYAVAQYALGYCYLHGTGVVKNDAEAVKWYRAAAEQGHAAAQNDLGDSYQYGIGIEIDFTEAVKWYRAAAEQDYVTAQYNLGICYQYGIGVRKRDTESVMWYRKAAEEGYVAAQFKLAFCYKYGFGVRKDEAEATRWFTKAAEQRFK